MLLCDPIYNDTGGNPAEPFIKELTCRGIAGGCGGGNFCSTSPVTRAQMAVFLITSMDEHPSGAAYDAYFTDVANDVLAGYINRLAEIGITGGCGVGVYCPNTTVDRRTMAVFLVTALEERTSTAPYNAYFNDLQNEPLYPFINRLYELGITTGCGAGIFCPIAPVQRDTMAVWMVAAFFGF